MESLTHYFAVAFVSLSLASLTSARLRRRHSIMSDEQKDDLSLVLAASLTLLALIISFSFSMATNRYDQRKNFMEVEANAIGTDIACRLCATGRCRKGRALLSDYTKQLILFFINADDAHRTRIDERISQEEADLWAAVRGPAAA
ncbi:hypothetical protein FXB40_41540 [Bradyrhizobium rifense]|uniref:Uncharacterized protein n=1 Tax=Bradyrhizobium rifense TaxID=515499 RepID=A0A5D3K4M1_9BRAD|nr:hypothetical protein [Bradyrhizobium rifense]TYL86679.1 hypothetical protein FXB40_41540 [Bradyrhizobium rifense]